MSASERDNNDPQKPLRALIVEDNAIFQEQLQGAVKRIPRQSFVSCAYDGEDYRALADRDELPYDLALIDLGLPDMSGIDIIRDIRRRHPDTIILVISVISKQDTVISAIRAGARGYILKGETQSAIAEAIQDVMAGNYPISPAIARYLFKLAGQDANPLENPIELTSREEETLRLIAAGHTYAEAAGALEVSLSTVQTYIRSLYRKLGAHSQVQAVLKARSAGFID